MKKPPSPATQCAESAEMSRLVHDLRNRLNNISMSAELAKLEINLVVDEHGSSDSAAAALGCLDAILGACKESAGFADAIASYSSPATAGSSGSDDVVGD